jgi:hypothetical protein
MKHRTGRAAGSRGGVTIRIDISDDELKALRIFAIERGTSVPKLIAEQIRRMLRREHNANQKQARD